MSPWITSTPETDVVGPLTMIHHGKPISLASDIGALAVLHGALQSAIATVDDANKAESAYHHALDAVSNA